MGNIMSNASDFVIENGVLEKYVGPGGDVVVPEGVTSIGDWAFEDCEKLQSITLPDSVTSVGSFAFVGCGEIEFHISAEAANRPEYFVIKNGCLKKYVGPGGDVVVPEGVTSIGDWAFGNCGSLASITLPDSVTSVGSFAFSGCGKIGFHISAEATNRSKNFVIENGGLKRYNGPGGDVVVPEGVMGIGDLAFYGCSSLTSVTIPEGVTSIGNSAFGGCENLKSLILRGKDTRFGKEPFGDKLPKGLSDQIGGLYASMTDSSLKQYVLTRGVWNKLDPPLQAEIFQARQGKMLLPVYGSCVTAEQAELIGESILAALSGKASARDCKMAVSFMTLFSAGVSPALLQKLYTALKTQKNGVKLLETVEADPVLMDKLSQGLSAANELSAPERLVTEQLVAQKRSLKQLEADLKSYYGLAFSDLPEVKSKDGGACEVYVSAWLFTAHDKPEKVSWGQPDVVADYEKPGLCPEAEEVVALLDPASLQAMLMKLADEYLVQYQNTKKKYLAFPICRYADEATMAELTKRAPKWSTSVSGNDAPPLREFRRAAMYSDTRAAMLFAERYHELDRYAALRGVTEDELRDRYLSDVGLDEQGGKAYDLGDQTVTVRLQKDLSYLVELPGGRTAKSLPKKNADSAKYEAANKDFSELKKNTKKIVKNRGNVLFEDFLSGRQRPASEWQESYLNNPLLKRVAKLVVWTQGKNTFILTDDDAADSAEQPYAITDEPIRLAHPMEMDAADVTAWQRYFTSHGLKQPFAQIWEPVRRSEEIAEDHYACCMIPYYRFHGQDRRGITVEDYDYHNEIIISFAGCVADVERIDWHRHDINMDDRFEVKRFGFAKYTRQVNHIVAYLDRITVWDRVRKDDVSVLDLMPSFTLAQITEFIAAAQEANAVNVLALLLDYKNTHFADFDPMDEFTLEW